MPPEPVGVLPGPPSLDGLAPDGSDEPPWPDDEWMRRGVAAREGRGGLFEHWPLLAPQLLERGLKVCDFGGDFRLRDAKIYEHWYKTPHSAPE